MSKSAPAAKSATPSTRMPDVLLVDDETTFTEYAARFLKQHEVACETAASAQECLKKVSRKTYDVIITDILMADNSDLNLVQTLSEKAPETPIIVITAHPTLDSAISAIHMPVFSYLVKPIDPPLLLAKIKEAIARRNLLSLVAETHERLQSWIVDVTSVQKNLATPQRSKHVFGNASPLTLQTYLNLSFANIAASLADLGKFASALVGQNMGQHESIMCNIGRCNRLDELLGAVRSTIATLDRTRRSFKSKELQNLRLKLQSIIDQQPNLE